MAGLLATRVLSDRFERVTLVERDLFPAVGEHRRGVPQGRHTHGLLASGRQVLDTLFPGISQQLMDGGALQGDVSDGCRWFFEGDLLKQSELGIQGLLMTRPFLEGVVRERVLALANVDRRDDAHVERLTATDDRGRVTGVAFANGNLPADLVLDATGRGSRSPRWLEELGYPTPREERIVVELRYTTRFFRRSPDDLNGDVVVIMPPTPQGKRGGVMLAQEGDRWTVTLIGHFGHHAPPDLQGFIDYAAPLPGSDIHKLVRHAEPVGEAVTAKFPASLRRRYEELERFPEGYLVIGDAISSFNPIYGQGMSSSALQALELGKALDGRTTGVAPDFFKRASRVIDNPWSIAAGADLRMPEAVGPRNAMVGFVNWYMAKLHRAAHRDPELAKAFIRVANLLAPPPSVLHPKVAMRVMLGSLRS